MTTTVAARRIELMRAYREWVRLFWERNTTLAQIVVEGYDARPD